MYALIKLALRNVLRNKRRSLISMTAIFFGVGVLVFLQGFVNGFIASIIGDQVLGKVGAIQIHKKGYLEAETNQLKLDMPYDGSLEKQLKAIPGVAGVAPRITFEGMLSNGLVSTMFLGTAIDPVNEYIVCPNRRTSVAAGSQPLDEQSIGQALIGKQLGGALDAKEGSSVTMLSASREGASNALDVTVKGFLPARFITESKRLSTVPLKYAQDLLRMEGRVTEYVVGVPALSQVDEVAGRVRASLGEGYEVTTWRETAAQARDFEVRMKYVLYFIALILFLLVVTGIINTMLMSVYERVREIGTMLAVGVRRLQILLMFLVEAGTLGLLGAVAGGAAGWGITAWLGGRGVTMNPPGGDSSVTYHPFIGMGFIGGAVALAVLGAMLSALYPAWKASRMRPVEALRAT